MNNLKFMKNVLELHGRNEEVVGIVSNMKENDGKLDRSLEGFLKPLSKRTISNERIMELIDSGKIDQLRAEAQNNHAHEEVYKEYEEISDEQYKCSKVFKR